MVWYGRYRATLLVFACCRRRIVSSCRHYEARSIVSPPNNLNPIGTIGSAKNLPHTHYRIDHATTNREEEARRRILAQFSNQLRDDSRSRRLLGTSSRLPCDGPHSTCHAPPTRRKRKASEPRQPQGTFERVWTSQANDKLRPSILRPTQA
jgi:hypothetical protein